MEKRYQVFISSTKKDLEAARGEVSRALLRAKCFPAQMENFNAVDEGQMDHIKRVIDQSDYFVLILGGMYGTIEETSGKSYTHLEYEYAIKKSKPIIRLLRKDPFQTLPGERLELDEVKRKKLETFIKEASSSRLCRFWESEKELGAEVALTLADMKESHPAVGWVKSDTVLDPIASLELMSLREKYDALVKTSDQSQLYITGDVKADRIKRFINQNPYPEIVSLRGTYLDILESISIGDHWSSRIHQNQMPAAERLLSVLLSVGSISNKGNGYEVNGRSFADFGFAFSED